MGRGRQKAKQTKVARELKYFSPDTNYDALQRELASGGHDPFAEADVVAAKVEDDEDDEYAEWSPGPVR
jgi:hypothetical protein